MKGSNVNVADHTKEGWNGLVVSDPVYAPIIHEDDGRSNYWFILVMDKNGKLFTVNTDYVIVNSVDGCRPIFIV